MECPEPGRTLLPACWRGATDENLDLTIGTSYSAHIDIYRNDGGGVFALTDLALGITIFAWGDYDNDGDLVQAGKLILNWDAGSDDHTPSTGLTYNLRVGTAPGAEDVVSGMAAYPSGLRRIPGLGNVQKNRTWSLAGLKSGTYYWSVQAVDTAYVGSAWAAEQSVLARVPADYDGDLDVDGDDLLRLIACASGPAVPHTGDCWQFDPDGDGDVDQTDFAAFQRCYSGDGNPADLNCTGFSVAGMVLIPAGEFLMGNSFSTSEGSFDELPRHAVYVDAFYMDRYEVTNQQYADALNWALSQGNLIRITDGVVYEYNSGFSGPYCSTTSAPTGSPYHGENSQITWDGATFGVVSGKEDYPMATVSWFGAAAYSNWLSARDGRQPCYDTTNPWWPCEFNSNGYRLPTEAEWEKAARGGAVGHRFPWSDSDTIHQARANYLSSPYTYDDSPTLYDHPVWGVGAWPRTSPVGFFDGSLRHKADFGWPGAPTSYQTMNGANGYGLYDMAGNVWEWCNDLYLDTYYSSSPYNNPRGPATGANRVQRGGGWYGSLTGDRVAYRSKYSITGSPHINGRAGFGFRLVLGAD